MTTKRGEPGPVNWGEYSAAVRRWELITGRPVPYPTQPGRHGRPVLAPPFVEWLMGLPPGWATATHLELPRTAQLRALGNGVMPQQAARALRHLLDDLSHLHCPPCESSASSCRYKDSDTRHPARTGRGSTCPPRTTQASTAARTRRGYTRSRH
ncbi:hypothetical protein ACWEOG_01665 [Amycolatopsis japonica]